VKYEITSSATGAGSFLPGVGQITYISTNSAQAVVGSPVTETATSPTPWNTTVSLPKGAIVSLAIGIASGDVYDAKLANTTFTLKIYKNNVVVVNEAVVITSGDPEHKTADYTL
jgi:hypothetical protein